MPAMRTPLALALAVAALAGCGGDDDEGAPPATTTEAAPTETAPRPPESEPREDPARTPRARRTLAECLRSAPGVSEVLEKGRDNEDSRYFEELVGSRVKAFALTVAGTSGEVNVFVFETEADAKKAAPLAGGDGLGLHVEGDAVLVAPASVDTEGIVDCLEAA
jgi:hypothetical protein